MYYIDINMAESEGWGGAENIPSRRNWLEIIWVAS